MIIGISGKMGSGKDTVAKIIQYLTLDSEGLTREEWKSEINNSHVGCSWQVKRFADKVKEIATLLTGIPREKFEDQEFKKSFLSEKWSVNGIKLTVREMLQKIGTDAMRDNFHPNVWVNALFASYNPLNDKWLITDTRFPNEARAIKERGGIMVRVERKGLPENTHISETALDDWEFDYVIENNGTFEDLGDNVAKFIDKISLFGSSHEKV